MARMYPNRIPRQVQDDPRLAAERRVYEALRGGLDDDYAVLFRVPYRLDGADAPRGATGPRDGEADFVVCDPRAGLLVLEVKGGAISRDGATGAWSSRDRQGVTHPIADPVAQARANKYAILHKIKALPGWHQRYVPMGHGVVLPDCNRPDYDLGPDAPSSLFAFADDMIRFGPRVREMIEETCGGGTRPAAGARRAGGDKPAVAAGPGPAAIEEIVRLLGPTFDLRSPIGLALREDQRALVELTEQQFRILENLERMPRVLISGGAGTGKTFLALEQARRLSQHGRRTLLTCFNRPLADFLRLSAAAWSAAGARGAGRGPASGDRLGLTVWNFHQLCYRWARRAHLRAVDPDGPKAASQPQTYFETRLPRLLLRALETIPDRFDAIIVDEAQDFTDLYWECLEKLLADPARALVYAFRDEAQAIFASRSQRFSGLPEYHLTENRRNTRAIHDVLQRIVDDDTRPLGPPGREPVTVPAPDEADEARALEQTLRRLIHEERFRAEEIAILTATRHRIAHLAPGGRIGPFEVTQDFIPTQGKVLFETVQRFKGLERPVIILVGLHEAPSHVDLTKLLYVGVSRAQGHLVVIGNVMPGHTSG